MMTDIKFPKIRLSHKFIIFWFASILVSLGLLLVLSDGMLKKLHEQQAHNQINSAFESFDRRVAARGNFLFRLTEGMAENVVVKSSISLIHNYQAIDSYEPLVLDVEKRNLSMELKKQASINHIGGMAIYTARLELVCFSAMGEKDGFAAGYLSYEKGKPAVYMISRDKETFEKASSIPDIVSNNMIVSEGVSTNKHIHSNKTDILLESSSPITRKAPDGAARTVGLLRAVDILDDSFFKNITLQSNLEFMYRLESGFSHGDFSAPFNAFRSGENAIKASGTWFRENKNYFIGEKTMKLSDGKNITLFFLKTKEDLTSVLEIFRNANAWIAAYVLFFLIPLGTVFIRKSFTKPVAALLKNIDEIKEGVYKKSPIESRNDEWGFLASGFHSMADAVHEREEALLESEKYNRILFEKSPIGLALCRMDGELLDVNQAYADIIGRTVEEAKRLSCRDFTPEKYAEQEALQLETLKRNGRFGPYEKEYIHKDGHFVPVRLAGLLLKQGGRSLISFSVEDISEKRRAEEAFQIVNDSLEEVVRERTAELKSACENLQVESEERKQAVEELQENKEVLDMIFETTHFQLIMLDTEFNFIKVNKAYADSCGFDQDYLTGKNYFELYPGEELESRFLNVVKTGEPYIVYSRPFEFPDQPWRETVYRDLAIYPIKKMSGKVDALLFTMLEVTERKKTEKELVDKRAALAAEKETGRLKSEFLASVSHELRSPLTSIIGFSDRIISKIKSGNTDKAIKFSQNIHSSASHLMELINDILDFSKIEAGKMELVKSEFTIAELFENLKSQFEFLAEEKGLKLSFDISGAVPPVYADRMRILQVMINLLSNAVKFTPHGGRIAVGAAVSDDDIELRVDDSGTGIDAKDNEIIFNLFQQIGRGRREQQGTGLGLAVTKCIVEMHGGRISVESRPGEGSVFTVSIPYKRSGESD